MASFADHILDVHGEAGRRWHSDLPSLIAFCEERWGLRVQQPFASSYNFVAPATRKDGGEAVVKLGLPGEEITREAAVLRLSGGRGMVELLDADLERGILLLERIRPGASLLTLDDDGEATSAAAAVMRRYRRPVPPECPFPTVAERAAELGRLRACFGGKTGPFPPELVEAAEVLFSELLSSAGPPVLLHGDLHHGNILSGEREPWLAIDPKGLTGEAEYETGAFIRNPLPQLLHHTDPASLLARRIDQFAEELAFDRSRIRGWAAAQTVLAAWWMFEDHGRGWEPAIACAEILASQGV